MTEEQEKIANENEAAFNNHLARVAESTPSLYTNTYYIGAGDGIVRMSFMEILAVGDANHARTAVSMTVACAEQFCASLTNMLEQYRLAQAKPLSDQRN